jgi:hypothetical protein
VGPWVGCTGHRDSTDQQLGKTVLATDTAIIARLVDVAKVRNRLTADIQAAVSVQVRVPIWTRSCKSSPHPLATHPVTA